MTSKSSRIGWRAIASFFGIVFVGTVLALMAASATLYVETLTLANDASLWIWWSCPLIAALVVVITIGIFTARRYGRRTIRL